MNNQEQEVSPGQFWAATLFNRRLWSLAIWYRYLVLAGAYYGLPKVDPKIALSVQGIVLGVMGFMMVFGSMCLFMQNAMRDSRSAVAEELRSVSMDDIINEHFPCTITFAVCLIHFISTHLR